MPGSTSVARVVLDVAGDVAAIEEAVEHLVGCCGSAYQDQKRLLINFRIGLTEALANAILYGNREHPDRSVRVELRTSPGEIRVQVSDQGPGFDPATIPDPRKAENISKSTGRGVFLMKKLMDEVHFNAQGNSVTMIMRDPTATPSSKRR